MAYLFPALILGPLAIALAGYLFTKSLNLRAMQWLAVPLRKKWPCLGLKHDMVYREAYDAEAVYSSFMPTAVKLYGVKCVRCGHYEPLGILRRRRLSAAEHAHLIRTGNLPKDC